MEKFYTETLQKLEITINELEIETDSSLHRIEAVIRLIVNCLSDVKKYVLKRGFKITLFLFLKPLFMFP